MAEGTPPSFAEGAEQEEKPKRRKSEIPSGLNGALALVAQWYESTASEDFLREDCRRLIRPFMLIGVAVLHFYKMSTHFADMSSPESMGNACVCLLLIGVGFWAVGRPADLRVDMSYCFLMYLMMYQASWSFARSINPEHIGEVLTAYMCMLHLLVAMGTRLTYMLIWFMLVWSTSWLSNAVEIHFSILVLSGQALFLHGVLQFAEVRKHRERREAQVAAARLNKLEQERAKQRQERIELCLSLILRHLKAPILLMKSELSFSDVQPEVALKAFQLRLGSLWAIFTGLETSVQRELDASDVDPDCLSQGFFSTCNRALAPQQLILEACDKKTQKDVTEAGSDCGAEEDLDGHDDAERLEANKRAGEPAFGEVALADRPEARTSAAGRSTTAPSGSRVHGGPTEEAATEGGAELRQGLPAEEDRIRRGAQGGGHPVSGDVSPNHRHTAGTPDQSLGCGSRRGPALSGVKVTFDPTDPRLGISALTLRFGQEPDQAPPGMVDLVPHHGSSFFRWVQDNVNTALHEAEEETGEAAAGRGSDSVPDSIASWLPHLRRLLQPLLTQQCGQERSQRGQSDLLAFGGLEEMSDDGEGDGDEDGGRLLAVVELLCSR